MTLLLFPRAPLPNLLYEPLGPFPQAFSELGRSPFTSNSRSNPLQLFFQSQLATCHSFLFLLFSRGLGRNSRGGVTACPNSPQGSQRKMRIPEFETLKAKGCPQKVHWPVVIGFFKRLCLLFTNLPLDLFVFEQGS
jgi:hypothetical protein